TTGLGPSSNVRAIFFAPPVCRSVGPYNCEEGATAPHAAIPATPSAPADTIMGQGFNESPLLIFARLHTVCQSAFGVYPSIFPTRLFPGSWPTSPVNFAGVRSRGKFVVARAAEAYDEQVTLAVSPGNCRRNHGYLPQDLACCF